MTRPTVQGRADPIVRMAVFVVLALLACAPRASRADTVASLLGNFTVNQYCGLRLADGSIQMHYVVVFGQLPALRELHQADTDGNGVTTQSERDAYVQRVAPGFADRIEVSVDGRRIPLHLTRWTSSLPTEQGGFSFRLDADFESTALPSAKAGAHALHFTNQNFASQFGWREIVVEPAGSISVYDSNAFSTSLTAGLTEALQSMPAAGPLDERTVHLTYGRGAMPAGVHPLSPRSGLTIASASPATPAVRHAAGTWLARETRRLVDLISTPTLAPHIAVIALLAAALLGALHAFSPGHGKSVVGAYLIGSRGTPRHAVFLGGVVTITHTLGVFALGFATLFASRFIVPERLLPILSLASGLLVLGMGITLLAQRWRGAAEALKRHPGPVYRHAVGLRAAVPFASGAPAMAGPGHGHPVNYAQGSQHDIHVHAAAPHHHDHHHDVVAHHHAGAAMHSHGGAMHSHLPPGADGAPVTWRSLLALGISGGLVPCPSAMVLLLAAIALNKTGYGLLLVLAFSVGLAVTLTAVGLAFLYARNWIRRPGTAARWPRVLPALSAGAITLVGAVICFGALAGASF